MPGKINIQVAVLFDVELRKAANALRKCTTPNKPTAEELGEALLLCWQALHTVTDERPIVVIPRPEAMGE